MIGSDGVCQGFTGSDREGAAFGSALAEGRGGGPEEAGCAGRRRAPLLFCVLERASDLNTL